MKRSLLTIGLIIVLGILVYANSFHNPFIWDDENLIVSNPYIKDIRLIKSVFTKDLGYGTQFSNFYRPLQTLSFELDYYLWGLNPFGFHLTNLILHLCCAMLVYFLCLLIFPTAKFAPLITALLFLIHPVQTEAVTYISGRADPLVGLLILLSLFFYIKHSHKVRPENILYPKRSSREKRLRGKKDRIYLLSAICCFVFALLSKETALILPLLILLYDISFSQDSFRLRDKLKKRYWPFLLVALIYILLRMTVLNFLHRPLFLSKVPFSFRMLTTAKIFSLYIALLILPFHLHMERSVPAITSILDKETFYALILFLLLAILIVKSYRSSKNFFFASMWFLLTLAPVANIVPLNANMAEHWLYLPSIGFFLLVAFGLERMAARTKSARIASIILLAVIVGLCSFLTIQRNRDWRTPQSFFQKILYYNPRSHEAHNCLGAIYKEQGKLDLAINEFKQAVKIDPQNFKSYGNLGSALRQNKEYDLAISTYKKALALRPDIPGLYNNLGNVYADIGKWQPASETFLKALRLYPEFSLCRVNLGRAFYRMGDVAAAISEYKKAITLDPNLVLAHYNLAWVYHSQQEYDLAIEQYHQVLNIAPDHIESRINLGIIYNIQGHPDQAIKQLQQALKLNPTNFFIYHHLGVAYLQKQDFASAKNSFLQALKINPLHRPTQELLNRLEGLSYQSGE